MKLLITGGAGFIGSNFIKYILDKYKDYKIVNLDILNYASNIKNIDIKNDNYSFIKGDICDYNLVYDIARDVDCIINFAAQTHVDNSINDIRPFIKSNIEGANNLFNVAKELKIKRFIQISTDEVYGNMTIGKYADENYPLRPKNPYSATKASADLIALSYINTYKTPIIITRSSNNYGKHQHEEKLIPNIILKLLNNEKISIYNDGSNIRDWLYVEDNCRALDLILHKGKIGEIYNISSHDEKTNLEVARTIINFINKDESFINYVKDRPGHDFRYGITNDKIKNLGFIYKNDFEKNLKSTIDWYKNEYLCNGRQGAFRL